MPEKHRQTLACRKLTEYESLYFEDLFRRVKPDDVD